MTMERIVGEPVSIHPLGGLTKTADLISYDGPILALFEGNRGAQYLYLWCDSNESLNRWLVFRVDEEQLARYLDRDTDLRDLVLHPVDGFVFLADIRNDMSIAGTFLVRPDELPGVYVPRVGSRYEFEPRHVDIDLHALADRVSSPLLNLHLLRGKGVGTGWSEITTLGPLLFDTGELAQAVAIDHFARKQKMTIREARTYGMFRFVAHRAASFSAILQPVVQQTHLPGFKSMVGEVVEAVLLILNRTKDYAGLKEVSSRYPDAVLRTLERLMESVRSTGADCELRWASPDSSEVATALIDPTISSRILDNINRLDTEDSEGSWATGMFTALDTKRRTYTFESNAGRQTRGRFDPRMGYPVTHLSFEMSYKVYITRKTQKLGGRVRPKVSEVIGELEPMEAETPG